MGRTTNPGKVDVRESNVQFRAGEWLTRLHVEPDERSLGLPRFDLAGLICWSGYLPEVFRVVVFELGGAAISE